eukprot:3962127-Amphidinium_carterae.1
MVSLRIICAWIQWHSTPPALFSLSLRTQGDNASSQSSDPGWTWAQPTLPTPHPTRSPSEYSFVHALKPLVKMWVVHNDHTLATLAAAILSEFCFSPPQLTPASIWQHDALCWRADLLSLPSAHS